MTPARTVLLTLVNEAAAPHATVAAWPPSRKRRTSRTFSSPRARAYDALNEYLNGSADLPRAETLDAALRALDERHDIDRVVIQ